MKAIAIVVVYLFGISSSVASTATDSPASFVGERARFQTESRRKIDENWEVNHGFVEFKILSFSSENQSYEWSTRVEMARETLEYSLWSSEESVLSHKAGIADVLERCERFSGVRETLTVPAGTFHTCRIHPDSLNTYWYAQVPFGFVKRKLIDGDSSFEENLVDFSWSDLHAR